MSGKISGYKLSILLMSLFFMIGNSPKLFAQGCSDAGFCTINTLKPQDSDSIPETKNYIKVGGTIGQADHSISAVANMIEYDRQVSSKFGVNLKFTTLSQSGNDIAVFGYSDFYINTSYRLNENFTVTIGGKIPLSDGNNKEEDQPLPMDYQSSLGTYDVIAGVGCKINKLQLVIAMQQPLTQNENQFFSEIYPSTSPFSEFQSTNKFIRSGDVLLRVSYPITLSKKFSLIPSLLPIYHLGNDEFTDQTGIKREISGSQGLTLNGNLYVDFRIDKISDIQLIVGAPFVVRDARPDGLTRSFIASLEYKFMF